MEASDSGLPVKSIYSGKMVSRVTMFISILKRNLGGMNSNKDVSESPPDYFRSTAAYYSRYRVDYPPELADWAAGTLGLDGTGRLLDVGCGTGKVTLAFLPFVREAVGIDLSPEMIAVARAESEWRSVTNITWLAMDAVAIGAKLGRFRLITFGDAFHWLDRERILEAGYDLLVPGGGVAIMGAGGGSGQGNSPWQIAMGEVIRHWLGEERRNAHWLPKMAKSHEEVLEESRFRPAGRYEFQYRHLRDFQSVVGFLYSTSFCNRELLGAQVAAFEKDLRENLFAVQPDGRFEEEIKAYCLLGVKE